MNREHQIRRMAKRIAEYGIEDLSIHDVDKFHDLIFAEQKERWDRALRNYSRKPMEAQS